MRLAIIPVAAFAGTVALVALIPNPGAAIFALWALGCGLLFLEIPGRGRWIFSILMIACGGLAAYETFASAGLGFKVVTMRNGVRSGKVPSRQDGVVEVERFVVLESGEEIPLLKVIQHKDEEGWRLTPKLVPPVEQCVLFLGGSFTAGAGLSDEETTAYLVSDRSGGRVGTHNFGIPGKGPNTTLAALQEGRIERSLECMPTVAIYQGDSSHVERVARLASYNKRDPVYWMIDGQLTYLGRSERDYPVCVQVFRRMLFAAMSLKAVRPDPYSLGRTEAHLRLTIAILLEIRERLRAMNPDIRFAFVAWDVMHEHGDMNELLELLQAEGMEVHRISEIIPDYSPEKHRHHAKYDQHPNALAHSLLADYLLDQVVPAPNGARHRSGSEE